MNSNKTQKHLMLDLDETLICSIPSFTTLPKINVYIKDDENRVVKRYPNVVIRPDLIEFLKAMQPHYDLNLFTAGEHDYAHAILNRLGIRDFFSKVFTRNDCTYTNGNHYKDLSTLPYPARDTILIDDMVHHLTNQSDQVMIVAPFTGSALDKELKRLIPFLIELSKCPDVRPVSWKYLCFLEKGTIPTFNRSSSSQKLRKSSGPPKKRNSLKNTSPTSKKSFKRSASTKKDTDSFSKISEVKMREIPMNFTQPIKITNRSEFSKKFNMEAITAPIKMKEMFLKQSTKNEADSESSDSEDCNVNSEDEMPPSDNPSVTRHLGPRRLKLTFF